ncbi:LuxR family transcriptional regulator [Martelella sp. HB161492]|uniref:helix-turn-helix transcriptional regulator n=1 Tax=Martelella sp. HB161492 TaxID=2720726 RepID=UPI0015913F04|nr:LuxR family transcriptional regulator [Martelella sp. HB161492]
MAGKRPSSDMIIPETERQPRLQARLRASQNMDELADIVAEVKTAFGFSQYCLIDLPTPNANRLAPFIHLTSIPDSFLAAYDRRNLLAHSAVARTSTRSFMPVQWRLSSSSNHLEPTSGYYARLLAAFGISMGMGFTFTTLDHWRLGLYFIGDRMELAQSELNELGMVALKIFSSFERLRQQSFDCSQPLSARETEVASWTAEGKTSAEIGKILGLSEHTVNAYLGNAIRKLDCVNRAQMVAKAIRCGLIR